MVHFVSARQVLESGSGKYVLGEDGLPEADGEVEGTKYDEVEVKSIGGSNLNFSATENSEWSDARNANTPATAHSSISSRTSSPRGKVEPQEWIDAFAKLETSLRSFILEKRTKSKLAPAKVYMENVLSDLTLYFYYNLASQTTISRYSEAQQATLTTRLKQQHHSSTK
jgi:hypothetical protein